MGIPTTTRVSFVPPLTASGEYCPIEVIWFVLRAMLKSVVQLKLSVTMLRDFIANSTPVLYTLPTLSHQEPNPVEPCRVTLSNISLVSLWYHANSPVTRSLKNPYSKPTSYVVDVSQRKSAFSRITG